MLGKLVVNTALIKEKMKQTAIEKARKMELPTTCSHCKHAFRAKVGKNLCPKCNQLVEIRIR